MRSFPCVPQRATGRYYDLIAVRADRIEAGDERVSCRWVFNGNNHADIWYRNPYQDDRFHARFEPAVNSGGRDPRFSYAVLFSDGSRGVCRVGDINRALAAAGARIDWGAIGE